MATSIEHILTALRARLPTNINELVYRVPLSEAVPQLTSLLRELADTVPDRAKLHETAPRFDAKLQLVAGGKPTSHKRADVIAERNLSLWNAVLPWESAMGLSYVELSKISTEAKNKEDKEEQERTADVVAATTEFKSSQKVDTRPPIPGMLFTSLGITELASPKFQHQHLRNDNNSSSGKPPPRFIPAPTVDDGDAISFWSGGIVESIDVMFLESSVALPRESVSRTRDHGPLAKALAAPEAVFSTPAGEVKRLDPFPAKASGGGLGVFASADAPNHDVSLPIRRKHAPFFVLELPSGSCSDMVEAATTAAAQQTQTQTAVPFSSSSSSSSSSLTLSVELSRALCVDIDRKQLVSTHFCPALDAAASALLRRLCAEVLQPGAEHIFGEREAAGQAQQQQFHQLSVDDVEFVSLCCRLAVGDPRHIMATWELLADKLKRSLNPGGSGGGASEIPLEPITKMIGTVCQDRSVWVPDALHALTNI